VGAQVLEEPPPHVDQGVETFPTAGRCSPSVGVSSSGHCPTLPAILVPARLPSGGTLTGPGARPNVCGAVTRKSAEKANRPKRRGGQPRLVPDELCRADSESRPGAPRAGEGGAEEWKSFHEACPQAYRGSTMRQSWLLLGFVLAVGGVAGGTRYSA